MNNAPKLHFIHYLDYENVGDWLASPLNYYADYFIKKYNVVYHSLEFIKWNLIQPNDAIILGGGGLFENEPLIQEYINRMLDLCGCVIGWSVGFHKREDVKMEMPEIDYSRFALLSIRDYDYPIKLEYVPCVTCLLPQLRKKRESKNTLAVINHTAYPITDSGLPIIDNSVGIDEMTDFIAESDTILTSSYHAAYWALLMGKKTIVAYTWANKFKHFKCKPVLLDSLSVEIVNKVIADGEAKTYDGWLDECVDLNDKYFEKVKSCLENYLPKSNSALTTVDMLKQQEWYLLSLHKRIDDMVVQINELVEKINLRFVNIEEAVRKK